MPSYLHERPRSRNIARCVVRDAVAKDSLVIDLLAVRIVFDVDRTQDVCVVCHGILRVFHISGVVDGRSGGATAGSEEESLGTAVEKQ